MLQIGDISIHVISDAFTKSDPGGFFGLVPRALWSKHYTDDEQHLFDTIQICLLIQTGGKNIVVDTGLGRKMDEKRRAIWHLARPNGDLLDALARLGVQPHDVHLVIDTHLHADHASGNTLFNADMTELIPTFPNAEYVVQRREYEDAIRPNERTAGTYYSVNWDCLMKNGQMRLLDGDTEFMPGVMGIVTPGHTPGHMSVRIESRGQHAAFLCDLAGLAVHFEKLGWMTAFDIEPLVTLETKRVWQKWALETNAILIFPHDRLRPVGRLTQDEKGSLAVVRLDEPLV